MQVLTQQWYKVTRSNGAVQYATKTNDIYYLGGSGFGYKSLDAISIEPIEAIPSDVVKGIANFEGDEATNMRAYCNPHDTWNGWAKPYIHIDDIPKFISLASWEDHIFKMEGDNLRVVQLYDGEVENDDLIEPTIFEGGAYYYLGNEGLVFDFEQIK